MARRRGIKKMFDDGFNPTALQLATFNVPNFKRDPGKIEKNESKKTK